MALATALWMPRLLARIPGAVEAVVLDELKEVIKDFCKDSTSWRGVIRELDVVEGERLIPTNLTPATERKVIGILAVYHNAYGSALHDRSHFPMIDSWITGWTANGDDPSVIELGQLPTADVLGALSAWVYYEPTDIATMTDIEMPEILKRQFFEFIMDGVLGRMYAQPNKPYTNGPGAQFHSKRYRLKVGEARAHANAGFTSRAQNWFFPTWGR